MNNQKELISIRDSIITNLDGNKEPINCFEYIGAFNSRECIPKGRQGIYIFKASESVMLTREMIVKYNEAMNWDHSLVGAGFKNTFLQQIKTGDVFYVGKVSGKNKSIYQRLKVHFGGRTESHTNGIKMDMPERQFIKGKLLVHIFLFDKGNEQTYIIEAVEKLLHESLHPLTGGKQ